MVKRSIVLKPPVEENIFFRVRGSGKTEESAYVTIHLNVHIINQSTTHEEPLLISQVALVRFLTGEDYTDENGLESRLRRFHVKTISWRASKCHSRILQAMSGACTRRPLSNGTRCDEGHQHVSLRSRPPRLNQSLTQLSFRKKQSNKQVIAEASRAVEDRRDH